MNEFVELVKQNYQDCELILKAYEFACDAHKHNKRNTGEPYIIHPISVAKILIELGLDKETIAAALLHDVVEDTPVSFKKIKELFGPEIEILVKGVSKISGIKYDKPEKKEMDSLRRLFISMSKDIRVILIKLADRLHNLRTINGLKYDRQIRCCSETINLFVPIAERLGLNSIKTEMEDICFAILRPKEYQKLKDELDRKFEKTTERMKLIDANLKKVLVELNIEGEVKGRLKPFYSLYKKIRDKGTAKVYDIIAFRIIIDKTEDCYRILGAIHKIYKPVPGRIKDYIGAPKPNGYRSLHTTVVTKDGTPFEVQIRTHVMNEYGEYGVASHWRYKSGDKKRDVLTDKISWIRSIIQDEKQLKDSEAFVKALQIDFSTSEICVFTPKYKPISLPEKSTPIDMAYAVHTELGNSCVGSIVNGKKVPLDYKLETGDVVEILTSKKSKGPSRDWLKIAVSSNARTHIRNFFKKSLNLENIKKGKEILEKEAEEHNISIGDCLSNKTFGEIREKYLIYSLEDMFSLIATGGIKALEIISIAKAKNEKVNINKEEKNDCPVYIEGGEVDIVKFARCCNPIPGDEINAVTSNNGITVHCSNCANIKDVDKDRLLTAEWKKDIKKFFDMSIKIVGKDEVGIVSKIINVIYDMNIPMSSITAKVVSMGRFEFIVNVKLRDKQEIENLFLKLEKVENVDSVCRNNLY